jgi:hypothetical protein
MDTPSRATVLYARAPKQRWVRHLMTVAALGMTVFGILDMYGVELRCERSGPDDQGTCTFSNPSLLTYARFPAASGNVSASGVDDADEPTLLRVPNASSGTLGGKAVLDAVKAYDAFVADRSMREVVRHLYGGPWILLAISLPLGAFAIYLRRSERSQRVLVDVEADEVVVEERNVSGVKKQLARHRLTDVEKTSIESVEDTGFHELVMEGREGLKKPLFRASAEECGELQPRLEEAVAKAKRARV